jgi:hypothetical protein
MAADIVSASDLPDALSPPPAGAPQRRLSDRVLDWVDRRRWYLFSGLLLLYITGFNGHWRLEPDSALYLSIGRNLVDGNGYTFLGKDHRLAYPGVPLLFAGIFKAFGTGSLLPHLMVVWCMGLACLALVYRLFLLHAGRPTAVLMTLGVGLSRVFYRYTFELLTDLPFLLGVLAFFVGYEAIFYRRRRADATPPPDDAGIGAGERFDIRAVWFDGVLMLVGLGLAVATRPSMLALLAAACAAAGWTLVGLLLRTFRQRKIGRAQVAAVAVHLLVAGLVVLAVALFYLRDPRQQKFDPSSPGSTNYVEEDRLFSLGAEHLGQMVQNVVRRIGPVLENAVAEAAFGTSILPIVNGLLAAAMVAACVALARVRPLWAFWMLATLAMVTQVPKAVDRYFLPVVPVMVFAWWQLGRWCESTAARRWGRRAGAAAFLLVFGIGGVPNTLELFGFVYEQRRPEFLSHYKRGRYATVYELADMLRRQPDRSGDVKDTRTLWVLAPEKFARILTFLGQRYCVEPDRGTALTPLRQNVVVIRPSEPPGTDASRPPVDAWLAERGAAVDPNPVDRASAGRWTLHRVVPAQ